MNKKIVYVVGGLVNVDGMSQVLSQKINYLAEHTDWNIYMILTERADQPWFYKMSSNIQFVNFNINFDELDTMPIYKKIYYYRRKQKIYKKLFTDYLMYVRPNITVTAMRREINFINDIHDGSKKIGEIHFNRNNYRNINKKYLPIFINNLISKKWMSQMVRQINRLDRFIVLTEEDKQSWTDVNSSIISVIHNPLKIIPSNYSTCTEKRVISVGRYTKDKGFDMLMEAWKLIQDKHPDWILDIYGSGDNKLYQTLASDKNVGDTVTCHPSVKNIYEKYIESSIFAFSSLHEGFGLALAEAMSCGVPSVSYACPCGPKDIIKDEEDGFLVKLNDIKALSDKICYLIENTSARITMGTNAKKNMLRFSEENIMKNWIELFSKTSQ